MTSFILAETYYTKRLLSDKVKPFVAEIHIGQINIALGYSKHYWDIELMVSPSSALLELPIQHVSTQKDRKPSFSACLAQKRASGNLTSP
jgi:alpha-D-ribose 1-methylphosphonate 5-triphosphate synthase subunit PhnI